jgi:hypothetical protein
VERRTTKNFDGTDKQVDLKSGDKDGSDEEVNIDGAEDVQLPEKTGTA